MQREYEVVARWLDILFLIINSCRLLLSSFHALRLSCAMAENALFWLRNIVFASASKTWRTPPWRLESDICDSHSCHGCFPPVAVICRQWWSATVVYLLPSWTRRSREKKLSFGGPQGQTKHRGKNSWRAVYKSKNNIHKECVFWQGLHPWQWPLPCWAGQKHLELQPCHMSECQPKVPGNCHAKPLPEPTAITAHQKQSPFCGHHPNQQRSHLDIIKSLHNLPRWH